MRGLVSEKMVDTFIKSVVKGKTMSLAEFEELVLLIEEAADATEEALEESDSSSSNDASSDMSIDWKSKSNGVDEKDGDGEEGEEEDGEDISEEDLEEMAKTIFEDLKGATNKKLSVKRFRAWDGVKEEIKSGALSKSDVDRALKSVGAHKSEELDFNQFKVVMDMLEAIIEENSARLGGKSLADSIEEELSNSLAGVPAGKGFGTRSTATSSKAPAEDTSEEEMITREIFDDLRGKVKKTLTFILHCLQIYSDRINY